MTLAASAAVNSASQHCEWAALIAMQQCFAGVAHGAAVELLQALNFEERLGVVELDGWAGRRDAAVPPNARCGQRQLSDELPSMQLTACCDAAIQRIVAAEISMVRLEKVSHLCTAEVSVSRSYVSAGCATSSTCVARAGGRRSARRTDGELDAWSAAHRAEMCHVRGLVRMS